MHARSYETDALTILAADDDETLREVLLAVLVLDGHTATIVGDGLTALEHLAADQWDIVLTDREMPGLDGERLAVAIKSHRPQLPVVMVTGSANASSYPGVDAIVTKPFTRAALARAISGCLEENLRSARKG